MMRAVLLVVVLTLLIGCGKKAESGGGGNESAPRDTAATGRGKEQAPVSEPPRPPDALTVEVTEAYLADDLLQLVVMVRTTDPRKRVQFTGWRRDGAGAAWMTDDAGNKYDQEPYDPVVDGLLASTWNDRPQSKTMKFGPGSITSEMRRVEILMFPKPPPAIKWVTLHLGGQAVEQTETFKIKVFAEAWRKKR